MFICEVVAGDGKAMNIYIFVFISPNLLEELGEVDELQADGTFWSVPKPFKKPHPFEQLFSLHLTRFGRVTEIILFYSLVYLLKFCCRLIRLCLPS